MTLNSKYSIINLVKQSKGDGFLLKKKYLCVLMSISLLFTSFSVVSAAPSYVDEKEKQIQDNSNKIKDLENRNKEIPEVQDKLKKDVDSLQDQLEQKGKELEDAKTKIGYYEGEIGELKNSMSELQGNIKDTENSIKVKTEEISKKQQEEKEKEEMLGQRLRGMYINNPADAILKTILDSGDFRDLISRVTNISRMIKMDKELIEEVRVMKENLEKDRKNLEEEQNQLSKKMNQLKLSKEKLELIQKDLLKQKSNSESIVSQLNSIEENKKGLIVKLDKEKTQNQQEISKLVDFNDKAREQIDNFIKEQINNNKPSKPDEDKNQGNSSGFIRPVSGPITCAYGPRTHPITGAQGFHHGVDIGAGYGTAIKAAQSGYVVTATYNSIYGNMVILSHGNGVQTVYAHAQSLNVSQGQQVKQGQTIAYVGSTGMSTGPHLHFEVRINGSVVSPMSYIQ